MESMKSTVLEQGCKVSVIPATRYCQETSGSFSMEHALRVAAYCRVSTGDESQQSSYSKQKNFYTHLILENPGWSLAGIYADEAISGTSRVRRTAFNQMMQDAVAGKIDYIITKSISRFARNTVDTLHCVRQLRQLSPPVGIYFEKESIDTLDAKGELILTILSALAQEESRSISENIRWAFQKNFRSGKPHVNLNRMLGYDWDENGNWIIQEEQAELVRFIFQRFLAGDSGRSIAQALNRMGKKTVQGNLWRSDGVYTVLRNEKYAGDVEMQKTITVDFLNHRCAVNRGEAPRYYVKNHHPPIISRLDWEKVQAMLGQTSKNEEEPIKKRRSTSVFSVLRCGYCHQPLRRMSYSVQNPTDKATIRYPVWRCVATAKSKVEFSGHSHTYSEIALKQSFMEMLYHCKDEYMTMRESAPWILQYRKEQQIWQEKRKAELYNTPECQKLSARLAELERSLGEIQCFQTSAKELDSLSIPKEEQVRYVQLTRELQQKIAELKEKIHRFFQIGMGAEEKEEQFSFFLSCLQQLPLIPPVEKMPQNGAAALKQSEIKAILFSFDPGIFSAFVKRGVTQGDTVYYEMTFGTTFSTSGNLRPIKEFLQYVKLDRSGELLPVKDFQMLKSF